MFDEDFSFLIEQKYPYPIAVTFRRLETDEYLQKGPQRLKALLEVAERTVHLLAHLVLANLFEDIERQKAELPKGITSDFERRFGALSLGTMLQLIREGLRYFSDKRESLFVPELYAFYFDDSGKLTAAAQALDSIVQIRNRLAHPTQPYSPKEIASFCEEAERGVSAVLEGLRFVTGYELLSVNQIEVIKKRAHDALFKHRFSRVVGVSEDFKAKEDHFPKYMESHAVVLKRKDAFDYLNLSPLVIQSSEGDKQVPDVFLYLGTKGQGYLYAACHNGGAFDSRQTSLREDLEEEFAEFFRAFSSPGA